MTGPTDPEYINASDEGKIRYFINWMVKTTKMSRSQKQVDDIVGITVEEWSKIKPENPQLTIDEFICSVAQLSAICIFAHEIAGPPEPSFSLN